MVVGFCVAGRHYCGRCYDFGTDAGESQKLAELHDGADSDDAFVCCSRGFVGTRRNRLPVSGLGCGCGQCLFVLGNFDFGRSKSQNRVEEKILYLNG